MLRRRVEDVEGSLPRKVKSLYIFLLLTVLFSPFKIFGESEAKYPCTSMLFVFYFLLGIILGKDKVDVLTSTKSMQLPRKNYIKEK